MRKQLEATKGIDLQPCRGVLGAHVAVKLQEQKEGHLSGRYTTDVRKRGAAHSIAIPYRMGSPVL